MFLASAAAQPLRLHAANPRYFEFQGKPVVLITSAEHYGAVLNSQFDYRVYLDTLQKDGMNYTRIFSGSYVEVPGNFGIQKNTLAPAPGKFLAPWARSLEPGYRNGGNKFDLDRWNPDYFTRLKDFVAEAGKRGIFVEMTLFCSTYADEQWGASPFNPSNNVNHTPNLAWKKLNTLDNGAVLGFQEKLTRKLVTELNGFDNVFFEVQNEPYADLFVVGDLQNPYLKEPALTRWPNSVNIANPDSIAWQKRVGEWIQDTESKLPKKHLVAQNYVNFCYPVRESDLAPGVSIINFHYNNAEASLWNLNLGRAISCDETGFQGSADKPYRAEAWESMLSGAAVFNNLDYSFSVGSENGADTAYTAPGGGSPSLRRNLKFLGEFFRSLPFVQMHPDISVVTRAEALWWRAFSKPGFVYAMYFRGPGAGKVGLSLPAGNWEAQWYSPQTGDKLGGTQALKGSSALTLQTPPLFDEFVLKVSRK